MNEVKSTVGKNLDDFEIVEELAAGNNARWFKARDKTTEQFCVLKRFCSIASNSFRVQRAEEEVTIMKLLHNIPSIVHCLGHFHENNDFFIVLEYDECWQTVRQVANTSNANFPERLPVLSSTDLSIFTVEMIRLLEVLHSHDPPIIHRDIKPENIFNVYNFDMPNYKGYKIKLSDFGSSVFFADANTPFSSGLTRSYMSPEVASFLDGQQPDDANYEPISTKTDMWNFGATLLDLAVDTDVFSLSKSSGAAIRAKIRNRTFQLIDDVLMRLSVEGRKRWDNLNPFIQEVIKQCLRVKSNDRPSASAIKNSAPFKVTKHLCSSFMEEILHLRTTLCREAASIIVSSKSLPDFEDVQLESAIVKRNIVQTSIKNSDIDDLFTKSICGQGDAFLELQRLAKLCTEDGEYSYPLATALLMCIFATGGNSIQKDPIKASELSVKVLPWLKRCTSRMNEADYDSEIEDEHNELAKYKSYIWSICFHRGLGVPQDNTQVAKYLKRSARLGYIPAINNLGIVKYLNPHASIEDLMEAFSMFTQCSLSEYPPGYYSMGLVYEERRVFPSFAAYRSTAFHYYLAAAKNGYLPAVTKTALGYFHGYENGTANFEQAILYFKQAAEHGDTTAKYYLGRCFENGLGTEIDLPEAFRWYEASAAQNHAGAQYKLGMFYVGGIGTDPNISAGSKYLHLSAQQNYAEARTALEELHL